MDYMHSDWRRSLRIIAYTDWVAVTFYLLSSLMSLTNAVTVLFQNTRSSINQNEEPDTAMVFAVVVLLASCTFMMACTQLYAIMRLIYAADVRTLQSSAVRNARHWTSISVIFIIFAAVGILILPFQIGVFMVLWRSGAILVVYMVILQLEDNTYVNQTFSVNIRE